MLVTLRAVDIRGKPVSAARVFVLLHRDGRRIGTSRSLTGADGRGINRVPARRAGCFRTTVTRVVVAGYRWDGRTPRNRFCLRRS